MIKRAGNGQQANTYAENPVILFFGTNVLSRRESLTLDILIAYIAFSCHPNVQRPFLAAPVEIDWQVVVDLPHHHRQPWS